MKRIQLLLSLGIASALLLAACVGDDDSGDDDSGDNPSATQTTASGETPSGGDPTNTPETNDDDDDDNGNGNGISELQDRIQDLAGKTFQASYEVVTEVGGAEQTGTITIAQDEPRFATVMELSDGTIAIIENEDGSFSCFGSANFGTCTRSGGDQGSIFDLREITEDAGDLGSYNKIDDRDVNGRDSECWQGTEAGVESTFCIGKEDGFLTYTESSGFTMSLTDYSDDVDDEIFELPYPVQ